MEPILQSIFESAVDGIIVIDAKGLIKAFNPAAERLFGCGSVMPLSFQLVATPRRAA